MHNPDLLAEIAALKDRVARLESLAAPDLIARTVTETIYATITRIVADAFYVSAASLRRPHRPDFIVWPRFVIWHIVRELTDAPYQQVATMAKKKCHGSVMAGCRRVKERISVEPRFAMKVDTLQKKCAEALGICDYGSWQLPDPWEGPNVPDQRPATNTP